MVTLAEQIDALLPQTQCGLCGYRGCQPYAEAIAQRRCDINRCPPGGDETIADLARLLDVAVKPLDPGCGVTKSPAVAVIDETWCIGCTLCIQACPVDAIVGAAKFMHTVIADQCTGCELCIPPCPVDCIAMVPVARDHTRSAQLARARQARERYRARNTRLAQTTAYVRKTKAPHQPTQREGDHNHDKKQAAVARALMRARVRLQKI